MAGTGLAVGAPGAMLSGPPWCRFWLRTCHIRSSVTRRSIAEYSSRNLRCLRAADELWRGLLDLALVELWQVRQLADQAEARPDQLAKANEDVHLLETVPGVGPRTAETIIAHLHEPQRFDNGKQVSAYVGLVPRQYQSGELDRRGRITRRGPALLRKLLVECAWVMLRYNHWAREVYLRLSRSKARKKQAICGVARKLLVGCWAMLRDQAPWRDDAPAAPAPA